MQKRKYKKIKRTAKWGCHRILSWILLTAVLFAAVPYIDITADESVISISTAEDLKNLANNCVYDAYSKDKKVILNNDIDLAGESIKPIAVFSGTFEGNNHTISNFVLEEKGSEKAFIIRLAEGATVRSLTLSGEINVVPEQKASTGFKSTLSNMAKSFGLKYEDDTESTTNVGGIVATNYGSVVGCVFHGKITGDAAVGGIVGENRSSGVVDYCTNDAAILGKSQVGGVVGNNAGRIESSGNFGTVNQELDAVYSDIGGIAGKNSGLIRGCNNGGEIGTNGIGNNIGGIVGRQKGRITACNNYKTVWGRKNVGGIAGRFEPFTDIDLSAEGIKDLVQTGVDDFKQTKDKIENYADKVGDKTTGILDDIHSVTGDLANAASSLRSGGGKIGELEDGILSVTDSLTNLTNRLSGEELDRINETMDTVRSATDVLPDTLDRIGGAADGIADAASGIDEMASSLSGNVDTGMEDARERLDDLQQRLDDLDRLEKDYLIPAQDDLKDIHDEILKLSRSLRRDLGDISDAITGPLNRIDRAMQDISDRIQKIRDAIDKLHKLMDDLLKKLPQKPSKESTQKTVGFLSSWFDRWVGRFTATVYAEEEKKVISVEAPLYRAVGSEWVDMAVIDQCYNEGEINGGSYAGGIAGNVGIESSVKDGENVELSNPDVLDLKGYVKATIRECIASQNVTAKEGYAGGIAGSAPIGWIYDSAAGGEIKVTDGEYAGGIAGYHDGSIERCVAITDLEAKNYIGGIAGKGKNIRQSYALPRYQTEAEHHGAIAGMVTGKIENNYFISEGLPGMDGADFESAAVALPAAEMVGTGTLPAAYAGFAAEDWVMGSDDIYLPQIAAIAHADNAHNASLLQGKSAEMARFHFQVSFYQDDQQLAHYTVDYDTVLSKEMIPVLQEKDGFCPQWDKDVTQPIRRNTAFYADYQDATTTIATSENPPVLLVEGNFPDGTTLTASVIDWALDINRPYRKIAAYTFHVSPEYQGKLRVHVRDESGKGDKIAIVKNGKNEVIDCERDGNYLIFSLDEEQDFVVLHQGHGIGFWILLFMGIAIILLALLLGYRFLKKKNKIPAWQMPWQKAEISALPSGEETGRLPEGSDE